MDQGTVSAFFDELGNVAQGERAALKYSAAEAPPGVKNPDKQSPYGRQLLQGQKVDEEHKGTIGWLKKNPDATLTQATRSIASEHLDEDKKYYTHLDEMEKKYKEAMVAGLFGELSKLAGLPPWGIGLIGLPIAGAGVGAGLGALSAEPGKRRRGAVKGALVGGGLGLAPAVAYGAHKGISGLMRRRLESEEPLRQRFNVLQDKLEDSVSGGGPALTKEEQGQYLQLWEDAAAMRRRNHPKEVLAKRVGAISGIGAGAAIPIAAAVGASHIGREKPKPAAVGGP